MRQITLVLPHYQNLGMWAEQQRVWMLSYPNDLRARLHVILVDDCSPKGERPSSRSVVATGLASLRIVRLLEKKRWNWLACRNLGAERATTEWLFLTDIDHVIPVDTLRRVLDGPLMKRQVYRFKRVTAPSRWPYDVTTAPSWKPHNDTWLLTRSLFFDRRVGGYDERLSGCYGTSGEFTDRLIRAADATVQLDSVIVRYPREVIPDASTPPDVYTRKNDPVNDAELAARKAARAQIRDWKPLHGLVPSVDVYTSSDVVASC